MAYRDYKRLRAEAGKRVPHNKIIMDPADLDSKCESYFAHCKEVDRFPTKPGLALWIGISVDTYDKWCKGEGSGHKALAAILKKAEARMSDDLQQRKDTMALFLLKQPCYGGYADKQQDTGSNAISINVSFGNESKSKGSDMAK